MKPWRRGQRSSEVHCLGGKQNERRREEKVLSEEQSVQHGKGNGRKEDAEREDDRQKRTSEPAQEGRKSHERGRAHSTGWQEINKKKKNGGVAGGEPAWLERQVQRANREGMQRYEDVDSHNCGWIIDLRLDFVPRQRQEEYGFSYPAPTSSSFAENCLSLDRT